MGQNKIDQFLSCNLSHSSLVRWPTTVTFMMLFCYIVFLEFLFLACFHWWWHAVPCHRGSRRNSKCYIHSNRFLFVLFSVRVRTLTTYIYCRRRYVKMYVDNNSVFFITLHILHVGRYTYIQCCMYHSRSELTFRTMSNSYIYCVIVHKKGYLGWLFVLKLYIGIFLLLDLYDSRFCCGKKCNNSYECLIRKLVFMNALTLVIVFFFYQYWQSLKWCPNGFKVIFADSRCTSDNTFKKRSLIFLNLCKISLTYCRMQNRSPRTLFFFSEFV